MSCGYVECTEPPFDRAVFMNPNMDWNNHEDGFCAKHLREMADPLLLWVDTH